MSLTKIDRLLRLYAEACYYVFILDVKAAYRSAERFVAKAEE